MLVLQNNLLKSYDNPFTSINYMYKLVERIVSVTIQVLHLYLYPQRVFKEYGNCAHNFRK